MRVDILIGIGNIANAIIGGMSTGPFEDTYVWTEVLQDTFLDFFGTYNVYISYNLVFMLSHRSRQIDLRVSDICSILTSRLREILQ